MRRFSQRGHLVTLNDINITPLLDLAFVLLIIFMITTPLLEQGVELRLPEGGRPDRAMTREDFRTLELGQGSYLFEGRRLDYAQLHQMLVYERQRNPDVVVLIRADRSTVYQDVFAVVDLCANLNLGFSLRSEATRTP